MRLQTMKSAKALKVHCVRIAAMYDVKEIFQLTVQGILLGSRSCSPRSSGYVMTLDIVD